MILPDEGERQSQTPSPPFNLPSLSHLQAFYSGGAMPAQGGYASGYPPDSRGKKMTENTADASSTTGPIGVAYSLSNSNGGSGSNSNNTSRASSTSKKHLLPRHNTSIHRLSDIGEEEGPSPPPKQSSSQLGRFPVNAPPAGQDWRELAASQARAVENGASSHDKDSGSSSSSNSTLSGNGESQQQQQQQEPEVQRKSNTLNMGVNDVPGNNAGGRDEVASAILSNEAERILENAKKRLTVCTDDLKGLEK